MPDERIDPHRHARPEDGVEVLKFGSSTLKDARDILRVARFLAARACGPRKLVVVVSALGGETDRLLAEARSLAREPSPSLLPRHLLLGEEHAASALALALLSLGLHATHMSVAELHLAARGNALCATPIGIRGPLRERLERFGLVVLPGFGGWCSKRNQAVLLGRGGSDLTAIHVAHALGLPRATLVKDVDGIYSGDPKAGPEAVRFDSIGWAQARTIAGRLVQARALEAAEALGVTIEIRSMDSEASSIIGALAKAAAPAERCVA